MNEKILCSVSTKGRYNTTLPLTISSIISQTRVPDKLIIFDDNDEPKDLRRFQHFNYLFQLLEIKKIKWEIIFGAKKGQTHNHQMANTMGFEWVWRLDDDNIAEPNVLETLISHIDDNVGAIGGSIPTPNILLFEDYNPTGKIEKIYDEPNLQWKLNIKEKQSVDHLHCSYLYRAGIHNFNLGLSKLCHREETLHTFGIKQKGYDIYVIPNCITWHLKNDNGGIRSEKSQTKTDEQIKHDEQIFYNTILLKDRNIVILNNGLGDHIIFKKLLNEIKNPLLFTCYPEIIPGKSIEEALSIFGDIEEFNVYRKMSEWKWTDSLENAFRKLYKL